MTRLPEQASGHPLFTTASGDLVMRISSTVQVTLSANPARTSVYPTGTLIRIAQHMTLAPDPSDASTWFTDGLFPN